MIKNSPIYNTHYWAQHATGDSGDKKLEKAWLEKAERVYLQTMPDVIWTMYKVFCAKQADYGPKNIALSGTKGVALRMVDKFSRLWNLLGMGTDKKEIKVANVDEALYDTLMDMADYAIIAMLVEAGDWAPLDFEDAFIVEDDAAKARDTQLRLPNV